MSTIGRFVGKVALVTGGGTGIGAASARRIADEGGKVVVMGRREGPLRVVAEACDGHAVIGDTTSLAALERAVAEATDKFGGLDVLVANAGIELFGSVETVALEAWRRVFEVNLEGTMLAARAAIPAMRQRGGGAIVLLASVAALAGAPSYVSYLTTKAGMLGLNRSIAYDYGPENIRCNALCPGWVRTEMAERAIADVAHLKGVPAIELAADMVRVYPLRRMAEPEEIASIVAFLASDDASFVTGATLSADGGGGIVDVGTLQF
jgi:NAD(P)-dependent dehydrogenase (short-subunit alcohol dehydrogenase family)